MTSAEQEILMTDDEEELSSLYVSLHARCVTKDDTPIYTNILIYVPDISNITRHQEDQERFSVVVLGFDALSQLNLIR